MTTTQQTQQTTTRHQMVFVNLPVADVARSREFFTSLGYGFNEEMCNASGLALELGPDHYAMLLQSEFFSQFHDSVVAEPGTVEVLTCLSADSREHVDAIVDAAVAAGGVETERGESTGFMYDRSYTDLDGHIWEIMWMDVEKAREAGVFG